MLLWHLDNLQGLGTNLSDADDSSSISGTRKRKSAGSMKQLGRAKRQKSCSTAGDVETPPDNVVGWGSSSSQTLLRGKC
ncbi:MAG: hypothetical protein ACYTXF_36870 [Nostoc sp.]